MAPSYPNNLPLWLKLKMEDRNLGIRELARRTGVSHPTISEVLNGKPPSLVTAIVLAKLFDETPETILRISGLLPPISNVDEFRELLLKETAGMSIEEQREMLAYISMKKLLKKEGEKLKTYRR